MKSEGQPKGHVPPGKLPVYLFRKLFRRLWLLPRSARKSKRNELSPSALEATVDRLKNQLSGILAAAPDGFLDIHPDQLEAYSREFIGIWPGRPAGTNPGGMDIRPLFWLFVITKWLNPSLIVESGVWRGQSTWLLRQAGPAAQFLAFDLNLKRLLYRDRSIIFHENDWMETPVYNPDPDRGLIVFDDHVNQCRRLREAYERGFRRAVFDDNVPPDRIGKVGMSGLPTLEMLFDPHLREGSIVTWNQGPEQFTYTFSERDTCGARELIGSYLVLPGSSGLTLVGITSGS